MATKKVLNVGKIMVLAGAVIILIMAAFLCGYFLKETHNKKTSSNIPVPQTTMMVNEVVPATTEEITTTTISETTTTSTTTVSSTVTNALTINSNGEFQEYVIKLANPELNIYSEPSYDSMVLDVITDRGSYVITKEVVDDDGNKWGLLETDTGWINLIDARKADPNDPTYNITNNNNNNDDDDDENNPNNNNGNNQNNNANNNNNNMNSNGNGGLTGVDADGDGWDDGWNPDAWCPYCGYDSYYNNADGNYYCSQGHVWSY